MDRWIIIVLLLSGCSTQTQMRVISTSDGSNSHCIEKNRIVCDWSTK